jgi:hypothetical protein
MNRHAKSAKFAKEESDLGALCMTPSGIAQIVNHKS